MTFPSYPPLDLNLAPDMDLVDLDVGQPELFRDGLKARPLPVEQRSPPFSAALRSVSPSGSSRPPLQPEKTAS
jgi:hypothetical protein